MASSPARLYCAALGLLAALASPALAALQLASPFGDHMVLQRDQPVPIWGTATPDEKITVTFAGQEKSAITDASGHWRLDLAPLAASAEPRDLTVSATNALNSQPSTLNFSDVLVGEVWLCGGQSNMERQLGPRPPQKPIVDWEKEVAAADHPLIRQLYVEQTTSLAPRSTVKTSWTVCSPATAADFTAVGYFFARDLQAKIGVPVGIIHSSWGGTPAEAWTSLEGLRDFPEFGEVLTQLHATAADPAAAERAYAQKLDRWFQHTDPAGADHAWAAPAFTPVDWETMHLPTLWEDAGHDGYDGIVWFRKTFDLPATWHGEDLELHLSAVDDIDTTWVNGAAVGSTYLYNTPRVYRVPGSALKPHGNVIAVRVLDTGGGGGIWDKTLPLELASPSRAFPAVSLAGDWLCHFSPPLDGKNYPPTNLAAGPNAPTMLYNAMIAPLVPYAIRGVAFYQGEANYQRARQYRTLLPALIADWRSQWRIGEFPFLFVQIAPFKEQTPEIREAQLLAWQHTRNTAMVVTLDCGDANDIHPARKQPVGARLALAARALAYHEPVEYSGPVYAALTIDGSRALVRFSHLDHGLVAKDGPLVGFTIAGSDGVFHPAAAEIAGDNVVVTAPEVPQPTAVRYAWANAPTGNLFNTADLPASPFRTDVE